MSYPSNKLTLWSFLRFNALQTSHGLRWHLAVNVCVFFVSLRFVSVVFLLQSSGMSWSGSVAGTFHQAPEPTWYPSLGGATSSSTSSQLELMAGHQESDLSLTLTFVSPFGKSLCVSPACRPAGMSGSQVSLSTPLSSLRITSPLSHHFLLLQCDSLTVPFQSASLGPFPVFRSTSTEPRYPGHNKLYVLLPCHDFQFN